VLALVSVGVFMVSVDLFIVNIAFRKKMPSPQRNARRRPWLVGARVIQAIGAALLLPTSLALLLPEFEPEERSHAIGIWAAIGGLAAAAGPPIGGLLVEVNWRLVFLVNVPIGLAAIAYGLRLLDESRDERQERPDMPGSALIVVAIGVLALGLVKGPAWGWGAS
jgi:MFS family permease